MNVEELVERAKAFSKKHGVPITKNEFEGTVDDPVPPLPYIVYLLSHETGRGADGLNNLKAQDIDFELYTAEDNQERKCKKPRHGERRKRRWRICSECEHYKPQGVKSV